MKKEEKLDEGRLGQGRLIQPVAPIVARGRAAASAIASAITETKGLG